MKRKFTILALVAFSIIVISACTAPKPEKPSRQAILDEITRLNDLNSIGKLSAIDFSKLENMVDADEHALDEIREIKTLSKYKEYFHVFHSFGFLSDYINSSIPQLCPGHSIAHYYVFMRHNETGFADENFEEAKENLEHWVSLVKAEKLDNADFDKTIERIKKDIGMIDLGNTSASDEEIDWLASDGSICVEEPR